MATSSSSLSENVVSTTTAADDDAVENVFAAVTAESAAATAVTAAAAVPIFLPVLATTMAVTAAATSSVAAVTTSAVIPVLSSVIKEQPFRQVLSKLETVSLDDDDISQTLRNVQLLQDSLGTLYAALSHVGTSPGFATRDDTVENQSSLFQVWKSSPNQSSYETFHFTDTTSPSSSTATFPLPPLSFVIDCLEKYQGILKERLRWSLINNDCVGDDDVCDCIATWHPERKDVLYNLLNQTLEQLMIKEASDCLNRRYFESCDSWIERNQNNELNRPVPSYVGNQCLKIINGRDSYIHTLIKYSLLAKSTIDIMTCYLFQDDLAVRYIFFDLIPYLLRKNKNLKVHVLIDLMTVEAALVKSLFHAGPAAVPLSSQRTKPSQAMTSFLDHLPPGAPSPSRWSQTELHGLTPFDFLQLVFEKASQFGNNFQVRFWCARDAIDQYRIKNHAKCFVVDNKVAIMGGSNFCPTVAAALNELDILVSGRMAQETGNTFEKLWKSMRFDKLDDDQDIVGDNDIDESTSALQVALKNEEWTSTETCQVAFLRSEPNCFGSDLILANILQNLSMAKRTIRISMGHANIPESVVRVFEKFYNENKDIDIQLIFNSWHSSDLRVPQKDLLLSVERTLELAPQVRIYITKSSSPASAPPPFLHAKYVVIDSKWSAVGSWNMWTRSSFHEIEHELLIEDEALALQLEEKFETEKNRHTVRLGSSEDCQEFHPRGCFLCRGFGPFCQANRT